MTSASYTYDNQNWNPNLSTVFWEAFELYNVKGEIVPVILAAVVEENIGIICGNILGRQYEYMRVRA